MRCVDMSVESLKPEQNLAHFQQVGQVCKFHLLQKLDVQQKNKLTYQMCRLPAGTTVSTKQQSSHKQEKQKTGQQNRKILGFKPFAAVDGVGASPQPRAPIQLCVRGATTSDRQVK